MTEAVNEEMPEVIVHEMYGSERLSRYMRGEEGQKRPATGDYVLVGVYQEKQPKDWSQSGYTYLYVVVWVKKP
jgi:hypothetical protein